MESGEVGIRHSINAFLLLATMLANVGLSRKLLGKDADWSRLFSAVIRSG